ncbi:hypothetical protein RHMOL_Rhmol03G0041200 [Rhododendron molle]|uniref:Uncharacterized protein n=1 Tax=Rhododendron molle TaxID=49168 RepID=A0ACC0PBI3_RHOML|nr:hypothetical protein RHMOL_Rhmol03G0041200 [Rhododendron molle]
MTETLLLLKKKPIELFSQLLKALQAFHDQNIGHGNLLGGTFVVGSDLLPQHVVLLHEVTGGGIMIVVH